MANYICSIALLTLIHNCVLVIGAETSGSCVDAQTNCTEYTQEVCSEQYAWAKKNCARFCGLCEDGCVYKGESHSVGKTWYDGCDYKCTCENGKTGGYRCADRCPPYQVPDGCVLRKSEGQCCDVPDCSGTGAGAGGSEHP